MSIQSPVTTLLDQHQVAYQVIEIPLSEDKKPVRQLEELLQEQGLKAKSVVRSIVFRTGSEQFVLLAVAGGGRADWASLREHLEERKLRMAEYEEVQAATGYVVGAVSPIALPADLKVLVDSSVFDYEDVVIGSGILGYALRLKSRDLSKMLGDAPMGNFAQH